MFIEYAMKQLNKQGEELCGDNIGVIKNSDNIIFVLSDGLGSGVKANILSTMTKQIALTMLSNNMDIEDVVETLANTLPVCKVRNISYSTFTIVQIFDNHMVKIVEFDNPSVIYIKNNALCPLDYKEQTIADKKIKTSEFSISEGDYLVVTSDGVINAGLGKLARFGWGWGHIADYLRNNIDDKCEPELLTERLGFIADQLYEGEIGDDTSILVIKAREKKNLVVAIGPPSDKTKDEEVVNQVINFRGRKVICGGTTAQIFSRYLNRQLNVDIKTYTPDVPPKAELEGFDLVTEGLITLSKAVEVLKKTANKYQIQKKQGNDFKQMYQEADPVELLTENTVVVKTIRNENPAEELVNELEEADSIKFLVGTATNPAYQDLNAPVESKLKLKLVMDISEKLKEKNKEVEIAYF